MADERKPMANIAPFGLRMQPDLKVRVETAAKANNRSLNAEIVERLERSFDTDHQQWETFVRFLRAEQDHIENMYLTGKTNELFYPEKIASPAKQAPLLRDVSDLVNRRTQLAMEVIVKELERKGMLSPKGLPSSEEWRELREAAREVQPDILAALANLDVEKALQIARDANTPLATWPTPDLDLRILQWHDDAWHPVDWDTWMRFRANETAPFIEERMTESDNYFVVLIFSDDRSLVNIISHNYLFREGRYVSAAFDRLNEGEKDEYNRYMTATSATEHDEMRLRELRRKMEPALSLPAASSSQLREVLTGLAPDRVLDALVARISSPAHARAHA